MTITVTQVSNTQTFGAWLATTNRLANIVSQNTVTTDSTTGGSQTVGNGYVQGYFGANYLYAGNGLLGGNVSSNGELIVLSNTKFQYSAANLVSITANSTNYTLSASVNTYSLNTNTSSLVAFSVNTTSNSFVLTSNTITFTSNSFAVTGNTTFANTLAVTGATTLSNTIAVTGNATFSNVITVVGNATFSDTLTASSNVRMSNTLSVTGNATFSNVVTITGAATLSNTIAVTSNATFSNVITVTGNATFSNTVAITGAVTLSNTASISGNLTFQSTSRIIANGSFGSNGQLLTSNGTGLYWATPTTSGGTVTSVASGSGLTGGPITSSGTLSVLANNGITANATGLYVTQGTGTVVNATGVHVNSSLFINTSNNYTITGVHTYDANVIISATGELIISNGAGIYANGGLGSNGQVLSSNGTGVYWANVASGGGGGAFNTNISNSIGFAANSTMSAAFTAPATAGFRYVIHSIHITNIGAANTGISGEFEGSTYSNVSFSTTVPVPSDSAVELLKMPKVMQPSDILKLRVDDNTALHATITYETQSSTNYFGAGVDITSDATYTDLYTATGNCVLQSVLLSNDDGTNDVKARVVWTDGSNNIQGYYCYDLIVPADSTVEILEQPKFLQSGYKVRVYGNIGNRLEAIIAGRLI